MARNSVNNSEISESIEKVKLYLNTIGRYSSAKTLDTIPSECLKLAILFPSKSIYQIKIEVVINTFRSTNVQLSHCHCCAWCKSQLNRSDSDLSD